MKRVMLLILMLAVCLSSLAYAEGLPDWDTFTLDELLNIQAEIGGAIALKRAETPSEDEYVPATRDNPSLIGQKTLYSISSFMTEYEVAIKVEHVFRGASGLEMVRSFNKYNARSLDKGKEWLLVQVVIEAISSGDDKINISDYDFKFVSGDGVELSRGYIADNPAEVKTMYTGSIQKAWLGVQVSPGQTYYMTYQDYDANTAWFDLGTRARVDTSSMSFATLDKKSSGEAVEDLQMRLMEYDLLKGPPNGKYDSNTISAVKKLQKAFSIQQSGIADEETLKMIMSGATLP